MSQTTPLATVGVRELRQDASAILRRVKEGEIIEITEHGKPIAQIGPVTSQYEMAIARGFITPAKKPGTLHLIKPLPLPKGMRPPSEVLLEMRNEERY
jgi:prevent-host-death family protein